MGKVLEYIIRAKDATAGAVSSAISGTKKLAENVKSALARVKEGFANAASGTKSFAASVGRNLVNIQAGVQMVSRAVRAFAGVIKKSFEFERMTIQFKTLVGNMDEAKAHMAMLQKLGETPPFSLEEFAKASRSLLVMTDGALGFKNSLEMIGDAAAATGQPIESLAHEVGRAYAVIRDGQPLARATMSLRNMGVITPEVAAKLDEMQKAGAKNIDIWRELESSISRFGGAMAETEKTGSGLVGAISSQWDTAVRTFGDAFLEASKEGLSALLEKLKELNENGTIEVWADKVASAVEKMKNAFSTLAPVVSGLWKFIVGSVDALGSEIGRFAGALSMGNFGDAFGGIGKETARAFTDAFDLDGVQAQKDETKRVQAAAKIAKKKQAAEAQAAEQAAKKEEELEKQMAEAQAKQDAKAAEELAAKEAKAAEQIATKEAELAQRELEREERERLKVEAKIHAERERLQAAEVKSWEQAQSEAERRLADAQAKVQKAWGWYRDKDSMAAQMAEEKADAEARQQYEKDFARLKDRRRDWRTATNLSVDDEAVRRVALAREEEGEAKRAVAETAANTRRAADALETIQAAFQGGE